MFGKTLGRKMVLLMLIASIIPIAIISIINLVINTKGYLELVNEQQNLIENSVNSQLDIAAEELLEVSQLYAADQELIQAYVADDRELVAEVTEDIYQRLVQEHQFEVFEIGDETGAVFYRAHNPSKYGDFKGDEAPIQAALNDESKAGFAIGTSGLNIRAFMPLKLNGEVIGTLQTGVDDTFLQHIIASLEDVSIHLYDVSGNPLISSGEELSATIDNDTLQEVLTGETVVHDQNEVLSTYIPMFEPTETNMIGFVQINQDVSRIHQQIDQSKWNILFITLIVFIIVIIISFFFSRNITTPIKQAANVMNDISKGNLRNETLTYKGKDEIKILIDSVNTMKESLRDMIQKVTNASEHVLHRSEELTQSAHEVKEGSEQIATTMEELSSSSEAQVNHASNVFTVMDDFTEKLQQVNESSEHIAASANNVLTQTDEGSHLMQGSASQMKIIDQTMKDSIVKVQNLEEKSKEINKIVQVIHDIADQTHLLSLNASIEAARAGEHGKGFAVVANEVQKLAQEVAESVTEITQVVDSIQAETGTVVNTLNSGYKEVNEGTKQMEATGHSFETIHTAVDEMAMKIKSIAANLKDVSENSKDMHQSMEEITSATEEASAGIEQTTASTQQSSSAMDEISQNAKELAHLSEDLTKHVSNFKL